jgi:transcriptional regulator with XRE-family HTH domain
MARRGRRSSPVEVRRITATWNPDALRDLLEDRKWTQQEFAERGGFPIRSVGYWLSRNEPQEPGGATVLLIAKLFGVSMEDFYTVVEE